MKGKFKAFAALACAAVCAISMTACGGGEGGTGKSEQLGTPADTPCVCTKVQHVTDLTVDKKGVEGAAVTIIANDAMAPAPDEKKEVYLDFVLDRAFGFIITDWDNVTLFSGVVNGI